MRFSKFLLLLTTIITSLPVSGQISISGTAVTEIVPLVTVKEITQLNIGKFSSGENGGTITLTPNGTRTASGSVILIDSPYSQGSFSLSGFEPAGLSILLPSVAIPMIHNNSLSRVYLDNWTYEIPSIKGNDVVINVGATLKVVSSERNPAGLYTGSYQVIFLFN